MADVEKSIAYIPISEELLVQSRRDWQGTIAAALSGGLPPAEPRPIPPTPAGHLSLLAVTDGALHAVVELHAPEWADWREWECQGCDADGYEWEPPLWPCRTVELIAEHAGVELGEGEETGP